MSDRGMMTILFSQENEMRFKALFGLDDLHEEWWTTARPKEILPSGVKYHSEEEVKYQGTSFSEKLVSSKIPFIMLFFTESAVMTIYDGVEELDCDFKLPMEGWPPKFVETIEENTTPEPAAQSLVKARAAYTKTMAILANQT